jgi:hypothetical protein
VLGWCAPDDLVLAYELALPRARLPSARQMDWVRTPVETSKIIVEAVAERTIKVQNRVPGIKRHDCEKITAGERP